MRATILALTMLAPMLAHAQAPAPGSGAGGGVGPSATAPTTPQGATPPGTPNGETAGNRALRDATGQQVIGKTTTPATAIPGETSGRDSGVRK